MKLERVLVLLGCMVRELQAQDEIETLTSTSTYTSTGTIKVTSPTTTTIITTQTITSYTSCGLSSSFPPSQTLSKRTQYQTLTEYPHGESSERREKRDPAAFLVILGVVVLVFLLCKKMGKGTTPVSTFATITTSGPVTSSTFVPTATSTRTSTL